MDIKDVKKIVEMVRLNELAELEIEEGDFRLTVIRKHPGEAPVVMQSAAPMMMQAPLGVASAGTAGAMAPIGVAAGAAAEETAGLVPVSSPIVGTFYRSPTPEADPFVKVGDSVEADSVVCIVEAMKVMNEIKAETAGVVKKIVAENATPVEYGQVLFLVDPA